MIVEYNIVLLLFALLLSLFSVWSYCYYCYVIIISDDVNLYVVSCLGIILLLLSNCDYMFIFIIDCYIDILVWVWTGT